MKKGKFLSSLAAAALSASMLFAPVASSYAAQLPERASQQFTANQEARKELTTVINIHKLVLNSTDYAEFGDARDHDGSKLPGLNADGQQITDLQNALGTRYPVKEAEGVAFRFYKLVEKGQKAPEGAKLYSASDLGVTKDEFDRGLGVVEGQTTNKTVKGYDAPSYTDARFYLDKAKQDNKEYLLTKEGGLEVDLGEGVYIITEDKENSKYGKSGKPDEKALTNSKAIPTLIVLPTLTADKDGVAHIYPKNTESQPKIDKNYNTGDYTYTDAQGNKHTVDKVKATEIISKSQDLAINLETPVRDKAQISRTVGQQVPYLVETQLDAGSSYTALEWSDKMTDGLTYDKNLQLTVKDNKVTLTKGEHYVISQNLRGFKLQLTPEGLKEVNAVTNPASGTGSQNVNIELRYSATVNKNAIVDKADTNDIGLDYDNNPQKKSETIKPQNGEIKAEKSWNNVTNLPNDATIIFSLYKIVDGKEVYQGSKEGKKGNDWKINWTGLDNNANYKVMETVNGVEGTLATYNNNGNTVTVTNSRPPMTPRTTQVTARKSFGQDEEPKENITITFVLYNSKGEEVDAITKKGKSTAELTATFKELPEDTYYVIENVSGYRVEGSTAYKVDDSTVTLTNTKKPYLSINPSEPSVVTGGKRFVKTDDAALNALARLDGAEFVIKRTNNGKTEYLAKNTNEQRLRDAKALEELQKQIDDIVNKDYTEQTIAAARTQLAELEASKADLLRRANQEYTWKETKANDNDLVKLTSDNFGRFEIKGLAYGSYELEETKAPKGYALTDGQSFPFTVADGSYDKEADGLGYVGNETTTNAKRIENKKLTIPQTGGIGSLIFIVAGLALMGVAFVAMKRRNSYEEA